MRKFHLAFLALALTCLHLQGQSNQQEEFKYLFNSENVRFSGFGGPLVMFGTAEDKFAVYNGGGGALLVNNSFFIGGYGLGLSTAHRRRNVEIHNVRYSTLRTSFGHGGFWFGYIHNPAGMLHVATSLKTGWGMISLYEEKYNFDHYDFLAKDIVFVLSPQIELEVNLTHWFKINAGLGYQFVQGIGNREYSDNGDPIYQTQDYNTPSITLGLLFGGFGKR